MANNTDDNDSALQQQFGGAIPIFCVASVAASIEYYLNALGFKLNWQASELFASVSRGRCTVFLSQQDQGHPGAWAWAGVSDADALAAEFRESGAIIRHPPTNYPWAYEMQVQDLDGNVLRFGSDPKKDEPFGPFLDMHGRSWPPVPGSRIIED